MSIGEFTRTMFRTVNRAVTPIAKSGLNLSAPVGPVLVVLGAVGRRTGRMREVPVLALRWGRHVVVGTVRTDSQWVANVAANPEAHVWLNGGVHDVEARVHRLPIIDIVQLDPGADPRERSDERT